MTAREERVSIRFTKDEYDVIEAMALENRMSRSTFIRESVLDDLVHITEQKNKSFEVDERENILNLLGTMKREIGLIRGSTTNQERNLNTIAKLINQDALNEFTLLDIDEVELSKVVESNNNKYIEIERLRKRVDELWQLLK